jgi:predicted nucleic acid-binding protein
VPLVYADSSALVKVILKEKSAPVLAAYLSETEIVSSELVLTEVPRALRRASATRTDLPLESLMRRAEVQLSEIALRSVDEALLIGAGLLAEPNLRSLDAIHVVTALHLYPIDAFVTYDKRQAAVARLAGLQAVAPGAEE